MFCSFKHCLPALTFKHCSGFSCANTFLFEVLSSVCITENTGWFENYFSEAVEERPDVLGFWIVSGSSVGDIRRSLYFEKPCNSPDDIHVLVTIPQALGCMQFPFGMSSRQVPHVSIYRYFEASPFYTQDLSIRKISTQMIHHLNLGSGQHTPGIFPVLFIW